GRAVSGLSRANCETRQIVLTGQVRNATVESMKHLVWRFDGRLAVAVHGTSDPNNLEWKEYLRDTVAQPAPSMLRVLVVSFGGGPTGNQRKELTETLRHSVPTAFLSNRLLARALVNTLSWFNPKLRAFELQQDLAAFDFLELTEPERRIARRLRKELEMQLNVGVSQTTETHP
ncbi:MAG TPA: hypothetical protein VIV60_29345, partial [Polyangiaceae bacterium]